MCSVKLFLLLAIKTMFGKEWLALKNNRGWWEPRSGVQDTL